MYLPRPPLSGQTSLFVFFPTPAHDPRSFLLSRVYYVRTSWKGKLIWLFLDAPRYRQ